MGWWRWDYIVWPRHDIWQPLLPWFRWNISFKMGSWNLVKDAPHQGCYTTLCFEAVLSSSHCCLIMKSFSLPRRWQQLWWITTPSLITRGHHLSHPWPHLVSPAPLHMERAVRENIFLIIWFQSVWMWFINSNTRLQQKAGPAHISVCLLWRYYQLTQFLLVISLGLEFAWDPSL